MLLFMLITFGLFWVVIKNNLLYCVRTGTVDGGGLFFPSAINQLFTGLYFMEVCLIGLFFLVRDAQSKVACVAQGIIMAVVLVFTLLFQIWLMNHFAPLFNYAPVRLDVETKALLAEYEEKHGRQNLRSRQVTEKSFEALDKDTDPGLPSQVGPSNQNPHMSQAPESSNQNRPTFSQRLSSHRSNDLQAQHRADVRSADLILARLNKPLDEARLAHLENKLAQTGESFGISILPRRKDVEAQMQNDPISKIIMQHNDELEDLDPEERDMLISVAFMHPVLRKTSPSVWIPRDELGISDDEVKRTRELSQDVMIDNRGAYFDHRLKVQINRPPPDMSEFALIIDEL